MLAIINKALSSGLLDEELCERVSAPSLARIAAFCNENNITLNMQHHDLLCHFGGSNLDVIRILGLDNITEHDGYIAFANDYCGFIYQYNASGQVYLQDTDGGEISLIASSIDDFFNNVLFGLDTAKVYDAEWQAALREHGMLPDS